MIGRLIFTMLPLLGLVFFGGFYIGRAGKKRAIAAATSNIRPVLVAARNLVALPSGWLVQDTTLHLKNLELALDNYDDTQRKALT